MRKRAKVVGMFFIILSFIFINAGAVMAIEISATGIWSLSITASDLTEAAGSDLKSEYEGISDQVGLTISDVVGESTWRVDVKKDNLYWSELPGDPELSLKRTGPGIGGSVIGGETYLQLSSVYQTLFSGSGNVSDIKVQLKISNISVQTSVGEYSTTVCYTVVET